MQIDRLCGLSKQIFVAQKQDRTDLMLVRLPTVRGLSETKTSGTQNFGDFGDEGQENDRMKLDGAVMTRAAPSLFSSIALFRNRREQRGHCFVGRARRQHLARTDNVAKWLRALFWAISFREGCACVDQRSCVAHSARYKGNGITERRCRIEKR